MKLPVVATLTVVAGVVCTQRAGQAPVPAAPDATPAAAAATTSAALAATPDAAPAASRGDAPAVLAPAPLARGERLAPCRVELEHTFRDIDVSDEAWRTVKLPVARLVRDWAAGAADVDWLATPVAPIPLTWTQARALDAAGPGGAADRVTLLFAEVAFVYGFDAEGRTIRVDVDPVADSAAYVFRYIYGCGGAAAPPPLWADDAP